VDRDQLDELELAGARGGDHRELVALFLVQDGLPDRRRGGDQTLLHVRILGHDQLVHDGVPVRAAQVHGGPESGAAARDPIEVHELNLAHALLQHRYARVHHLLPFLCGLVFCVLTQIAVLARALDFFRKLVPQLALERGNLVGEPLQNAILHREIDSNIAG
jgi:hypothetical protein